VCFIPGVCDAYDCGLAAAAADADTKTVVPPVFIVATPGECYCGFPPHEVLPNGDSMLLEI